MKKRNKQSGQALMELLVLLLSFVICFLGLLLIMGFSIANIEILSDAKFNAEKSAQNVTFGSDGKDIHKWKYTFYEAISEYIPFLPLDEPGGLQNNLDSFNKEFNNELYSNHDDKYAFNDFGAIAPVIANNFPNDTPSFSYQAANLHEGKSNEFYDENNALLTDHRYFKRQQIYEAFEKIIGTKLKDIDLENNHSNTVYFPAMKVLESGSKE